ncbi:diablo IAP-binding mitochondrial protein-like [Glandiceps talaboti]
MNVQHFRAILRLVHGFRRMGRSSFLKDMPKLTNGWNIRKFGSLVTIGTGMSICAQVVKPTEDKADQPQSLSVDPSSLTHPVLIRNAASLTVNAASTLLSQTAIGLIDALQDYAKEIYTLISLIDHETAMLGHEKQQEKIWPLIIQTRNEIEGKKQAVEKLESMLHFAIKVVESASEAAFQSGSDVAAIAAAERIHQAQTQIDNAKQIVQQAKDRLNEAQRDSVVKTSKHGEDAEDSADKEP